MKEENKKPGGRPRPARRGVDMKLSVKILVIATALLIISVLVTAGVSILENISYNEKIGYERVDTASRDLATRIEEMLEHSKGNAVSIAQNYPLIKALENKDFNGMQKARTS